MTTRTSWTSSRITAGRACPRASSSPAPAGRCSGRITRLQGSAQTAPSAFASSSNQSMQDRETMQDGWSWPVGHSASRRSADAARRSEAARCAAYVKATMSHRTWSSASHEPSGRHASIPYNVVGRRTASTSARWRAAGADGRCHPAAAQHGRPRDAPAVRGYDELRKRATTTKAEAAVNTMADARKHCGLEPPEPLTRPASRALSSSASRASLRTAAG